MTLMKNTDTCPTSLFPHLENAILEPGFTSFEEMAHKAEAWETAPWSADGILQVELLTPIVRDPCSGRGVLTQALRKVGYKTYAQDLYDWGYEGCDKVGTNWLNEDCDLTDQTVFMNPPFSLACQFVDKAFELNARKIVCFQRQAWRESKDRRSFWSQRPPARVWVCGNRAETWLFHIPPEERKGGRNMPSAWYVWEKGHKGAEVTSAIYKNP